MSGTGALAQARRLRIAILNRNFSTTGGGAEGYSIALVRQLAGKHEIHVFAQDFDPSWPGVDVHLHRVSAPMRKPRWINQLWYATATWWATRRGFDVVHSHENTWHGNVQTFHVLPVRHNLFSGKRGAARLLRWVKVVTSPRLLTYLALEKLRFRVTPGRQLVVTSASLQHMVLQSYPEAAGRLSIVTPGIRMPEQRHDSLRKSTARTALGLPPDATCLLFVGNDYRKKGLPGLLAAFADLPPDAVLAVVGNPAQIPAFAAQVKAMGLDGRVFFLGSLPDVTPAYEAADILVHPTLEDTFAMVVLEAMSHGLPVVVSAAQYCGIAGLLSHGSNALVLENPRDPQAIGEAVTAILESPPLRQSLSANAAAFAARFEWPEIALRQAAVYDAAVAGR
ncbi:MAG: glycosyltransferase family 1 protein [Comamonadaceae bacterium]|nr:MAG: glycosyltransferase family 1 protein [Comamonadaceae bacterium]